MNLFQLQSDVFHRIINPTKLTDAITNQPLAVWKVLVIDENTISILANFKVGDLRESNITLHLGVTERKEPLPGVEAVYLLSSDAGSLRACAADVAGGIFDSAFINIVGTVDQKAFAEFCDELIRTRRTYVVQEIKQFPIDFAPITQNCFSFCLANSTFNQSADFEDEFARRLLSLFAALEYVPLLCYNKSSDRLRRIVARVTEGFEGKNGRVFLPEFDKMTKNNKALLVLNESGKDPASFLYRSFQFLPLMAESLGLFRKRSAFYSAKIDEQKLTVDMKSDKFLQKNMATEYPLIGGLIDDQYKAVKAEYDRILKPLENKDDQGAFADNFSEAIEAVPIVTESKKNSENYIKIALSLNKEIQSRELEKVCVLSQFLWRNRKLSGDFLIDFENVLKSPQVLKTEKLRLFALASLNWQVDAREYDRYEKLMIDSSQGWSEIELAFLKRLKVQKYSTSTPSQGGSYLATIGSFAKKQLIGDDKYATKVAPALSSLFRKRDMEEWKFVALGRSSDNVNFDAVTQLIVVSVDGGNWAEYFELNDLAATMKKDLVYGMSELVGGARFLEKMVNRQDETAN